jgi:hypothetical protein
LTVHHLRFWRCKLGLHAGLIDKWNSQSQLFNPETIEYKRSDDRLPKARTSLQRFAAES